MFRKKIFAVLILVIVSLLCSCLEDTQPHLKYTITRGKNTAKIKFYHSKGDMLNEVIIEFEDNHVKALYQDSTLIIPVSNNKEYSVISLELIYFGDGDIGVLFESTKEKSGKIQYIILHLEY